MAAPTGAAIADRFGRNLKRARTDADLSQEEVGIRASLHRTEIGLLERGERIPRIDTAIKLAGSVDVPCEELLAGIEWTPGSAQPGTFVASCPEGSSETRGGAAPNRTAAGEDPRARVRPVEFPARDGRPSD